MDPRDSSDGLQFGAVADALRYGWRLILLAVVVAAAAAALFAFQQTPTYEATSVVYVETEDGAASPLGDTPLGEALGITNGRSLANEVQMLQLSTELQEAVAARLLGVPDSVLEADPPASVGETALELRESTVFEPLETGVDMIEIRALSEDPVRAAEIANTYARVYSERGRAASQAGMRSARSYLEEQAEERRAELLGIESELQGVLTSAGTPDISAEGQTTITQAASADAAVDQARVELGAAQARRAQLAQELARVRAGLAGRVSSSARGEVAALQERVASLELQAEAFYARDPSLRGDEGRVPELATLRQSIESARQRLAELSGRVVDETLASGDASGQGGLGYVTELQRQIASEDVAIQGLRQRLGVLRSRQASHRGSLRQLPAQQMRVAQLERERLAAEQTYLALDERARALGVAEKGELAFVEVVQLAEPPPQPIAPNVPQIIGLGGVLGLLLGLGVAFLRHSADARVRTAAEVSGRGLRVIGTVPDFGPQLKKSAGRGEVALTNDGAVSPIVASGADPFSLITEAFRYLRASVRFARPERRPHVLLVASPGPGEGKSTVAMGLAVAWAQAGLSTLYVDADLRKPTAHHLVGAEREGGLSDRLRGAPTPDWEALRREIPAAWGDVSGGGLYVLTAGRAVGNPTELLESPAMAELLAEAEAHFDMVIVDSSPVLPVPDALHVAGACDSVVIVAQSGQTDMEALELTNAALLQAGADVLGVILNRATDRGLAGYGYDYAPSELFVEARGDGAARALPPHPSPTP